MRIKPESNRSSTHPWRVKWTLQIRLDRFNSSVLTRAVLSQTSTVMHNCKNPGQDFEYLNASRSLGSEKGRFRVTAGQSEPCGKGVCWNLAKVRAQRSLKVFSGFNAFVSFRCSVHFSGKTAFLLPLRLVHYYSDLIWKGFWMFDDLVCLCDVVLRFKIL